MPDHKISNTTASFMIVVAALVDALQAAIGLLHLIPLIGNVVALIANTVVSFIALGGFWLWFAINGVYIGTRARGVVTTIATFVIEFIPVIKLLPAWTFWVWRMTLISRIREHTAVRPATGRRMMRSARRKSGRRGEQTKIASEKKEDLNTDETSRQRPLRHRDRVAASYRRDTRQQRWRRTRERV